MLEWCGSCVCVCAMETRAHLPYYGLNFSPVHEVIWFHIHPNAKCKAIWYCHRCFCPSPSPPPPPRSSSSSLSSSPCVRFVFSSNTHFTIYCFRFWSAVELKSFLGPFVVLWAKMLPFASAFEFMRCVLFPFLPFKIKNSNKKNRRENEHHSFHGERAREKE